MATLEDEVRDLREKNNELVQKVQYWKVAAATKENEKLDLMKEINELRLKLSRLRSGGAAQARKLDAALQSTSEDALNHLVQASSAVARTIELAKTYMRERQDLDNASPRWSAIGGTPNMERVHRVPPMMIGGQSIQPVVSLSRIFNTRTSPSNSQSVSRSPNQNRNVTERAVPMRMLQDVYIPLRRIDASDFPNNMETEGESGNEEDSAEESDLDDSAEIVNEPQNISEEEDLDASRRLEAVTEDLEPENTETPPRNRTENPLEGPSWLLDQPSGSRGRPKSMKRRTLEPDSTTELDENALNLPTVSPESNEHETSMSAAPAFTPTVRRRKRTSSPHAADASPHRLYSPRPASRRNSTSGRVLKVLVAKMSLEQASPPKRARSPGAPSPNGATDIGVIVQDDSESITERTLGDPGRIIQRDSRLSHDSRRTLEVVMNEGHSSRRPSFNLLDIEDRLGSERRGSIGDRRSSIGDRRGSIGDRRGSIGDRRASIGERRGSIGDRRGSIGDRRGSIGDRRGSIGVRRDSIGDSENVDQERDTRDEHNMNLGTGDGLSNVEVKRESSVESRMGSVGEGHSRFRFGSGVDGRDSDSSVEHEGRTRRPRKAVTYKERPLNRKMRR